LKQVVGIGVKTAEHFIDKGITSIINDLKYRMKNTEIEFNDKILSGLKYHKLFLLTFQKLK